MTLEGEPGKESRVSGAADIILGLGNKMRIAFQRGEGKPRPDAEQITNRLHVLESLEPPILGTRGAGARTGYDDMTDEEFSKLSTDDKLKYFDLPESRPRFRRTQKAIDELTRTYD
jgi:hypothetical protein